MISTLRQVRDTIKRRMHIISYTVLFIGLCIWYIPSINIMRNQDAWLYVIKSDITINFLLLFYLWGHFSDVYCKKKGWTLKDKRGWLVWGAGLILLILFFNIVGGYTAIWNK